MNEYKTCQCGSSNVFMRESEDYWSRTQYYVICDDCRMCTEECFTMEEAAKIWNNRPLEDELLSIIKHFHLLIDKIVDNDWISNSDFPEETIKNYRKLINDAIAKAEGR